MSGTLPQGWVTSTIGDACESVSKRGPSGTSPTFRYLDLSSIDNKTKSIIQANELNVSDAPSRAKQVVRAGDVLFSNVRVYLENIASVPGDLDGEIASTAFCVLRPTAGIDARYLYYFATSRPFVRAVDAMQRGNSPPSVQDGDVKSQSFPVPPTNEQSRICSKIDELFSRIDEGEAALARVEKLVERYRQSVLKAAVTGELTRDWRAAKKRAGEPVESGAALLARILKARRAAWEAAELAKFAAKGKPPTDDRWKQKYQEPAPPDTTGLPELPDGWVWASMDQLTIKITSGSRDWKAYYGRGDGVFVMAQNVRPSRFDMTDVQRVDPPDGDRDAERSEITENDLLITIVGANTGDVCRVDRPVFRHYVCQSVALMRPTDMHLSEYIAVYLNTRDAGRAELDNVIYGAGRPHLSFDQLRAIRVPIPPATERAVILDSLSDSESQLLGVRGNLIGLGKASAALRQSILKAAFSGQLVPQDPHDEPASKLLERIAAERASAPSAKAHRGRRKGASA